MTGPRKQVGRGYDGLLPPGDAVRDRAVDEAQRNRLRRRFAEAATRMSTPDTEHADLAEALGAMGLLADQHDEWT